MLRMSNIVFVKRISSFVLHSGIAWERQEATHLYLPPLFHHLELKKSTINSTVYY
jgi:hypothetical protein